MPEVWFIRHGESTANVGGATRTAEEAELTPRGYQQARYVADYLRYNVKGKSIRIVTSFYKRAQQTAQPTQFFFDKARVEIWPVHEFNYLALPTNTFTTSTDRLPLVKDFWERCSPSFKHQDKAESFTQFMERVQGVIESLYRCGDDQLIVVFSHQQFILAVKWLLEQEQEVQTGNLKPSEMSHFHHLLCTWPMPNGAILKTLLGPKTRQVFPDIEVSHLTRETAYTRDMLFHTGTELSEYPTSQTLSLTVRTAPCNRGKSVLPAMLINELP